MRKYLPFLKRLFILPLIAVITAGSVITPRVAQAKSVADNADTVMLCLGSSTGLSGGVATAIDADPLVVPFAERDIIYIPLSFAAKALGGSVRWDGATRTVTLTYKGTVSCFTIDADTAQRGPHFSETVLLEAPVLLYREKTYVPLYGFAATIGQSVRYERGLIMIGGNAVQPEQDAEQVDAWIAQCNALPIIGTEERFLQMLASVGISHAGDMILYAPTMEGGTNAVIVEESTAGAQPPVPGTGGTANNGQVTPQAPDAGQSLIKDTSESLREAAQDNAATEADAYAETNVQTAGVDEGDVIKTDGTYIYYLSQGRVSVVKAVPPEQMTLAYTLTFDDPAFRAQEVYVDGNTAVVIGEVARVVNDVSLHAETDVSSPAAVYSKGIYAGRTMTRVYIYDITDRTQIKMVRKVETEGMYLSSRRIGTALYLVTNQNLYALWRREGYLRPEYRDSAAGDAYTAVAYHQIYYFPGLYQQNYLTVTGIMLDDPETPVQLTTYYGAGETLYVSTQHMYIAARQYAAGLETGIYKFALNAGQITFAAKGSVPGTVLNQFSMDEYNQFFRIATTHYDTQYGQANNLYVLDGALSVTGKIEDIAPGEKIYSVRFMGNRGYMVTFKNVDPLFAFDLSDPYAPQILGALKIPGYSDYLHPYDENHLIGFGKDTVEQYGAAYYQGMKISLFDVTDMTNPIELFTEVIGDRGTESELLRNHRALLFSREKNLLAFPVTVMEIPPEQQNNDATVYGQFTFQGVQVYGIDLEKGFVYKGGVTHLTETDSLKAGLYGGHQAQYVQRALYIGDVLYTASDAVIKANRLSDMQELGAVSLR